MKVGIDTFGSDHGRSGIGSYIKSIVKNLPVEDKLTFELFGSEFDRYTFTSDDKQISYVGVNNPDSISADRLWHLFKLKKFAKKRKFSAVLYPAGSRVLPFSFSAPGVAVVNDVVSTLLHNKNDFWQRYIMIHALRRATKIIAASQYIKKDLGTLRINLNNVEVIHNGIDHSLFYPHTELDGDTVLIKPFSIKRPYIIYATRIQGPSKKHIELIDAFTVFKDKTGLPHRLVLAGDGEYSEIVFKAVSGSKYASDIFLTGYFPHENLPELYSCADACVFPSVAEGVGLPIIEAMATGIPVACAKAGSLPEIAGDCALYFNPDNTEETANVLASIINDEKIREKLIKSGLEWTKRFSWEKTTLKTINVLKDVAGLSVAPINDN